MSKYKILRKFILLELLFDELQYVDLTGYHSVAELILRNILLYNILQIT